MPSRSVPSPVGAVAVGAVAVGAVAVGAVAVGAVAVGAVAVGAVPGRRETGATEGGAATETDFDRTGRVRAMSAVKPPDIATEPATTEQRQYRDAAKRAISLAYPLHAIIIGQRDWLSDLSGR